VKRLILIVVSLLIIGCSTIDGYVEGWPDLKITVHESHLLEINQKCWKYLSTIQKLLGSVVFGCSIIDLDQKTCDIYLAANSPELIMNHELAHCKGGDHPDGSLDKFYDEWLDAHSRASDHYSTTPPRILTDQSCVQYWDHSSKFGSVPQEISLVARQFCAGLKKSDGVSYKAIGYHPLAQSLDGKTYISGGYLCIPN